MGEEYSEERLKEIRVVFDILDKDQSGKLERGEVASALRGMGANPTDADVQKLIDEVDADDDGKIDFDEFVKKCSPDLLNTNPEKESEEMKAAFKLFDKDGNGYVDADELRKVLTSLGEVLEDEAVDELLKEADVNGDGKIDYNEFAAKMVA